MATVLASSLLASLLAISPSFADCAEDIERGDAGGIGIVTEVRRSCDESDAPSAERARERRTSYRVGATDADGNPCLGWGSRPVTNDEEERRVQREQNEQLERWYHDNDLMDRNIEDRGGGLPGLIDGRFDLVHTPGDVGDCVFPPGFIDALYATIVHTLDTPQPYVAPGYAITGLPAYLEVGAPTSFDQTLSALGIAVRVWGEADYHVDWGDGRQVLYERDNGAPYPHGNLRHTYAEVADPRTITVTGIWTLNWSARGQTVSGIRLELTETYDLPVRQLQAVRTTSR